MSRFNVAAGRSPRKYEWNGEESLDDLPLQWGRGFSAAESCRRSSMGRRASGFNGAAAFQPRKVAHAVILQPNMTASMGPRLFSRGKGRRHIAQHHLPCASMGPRLFSRGKGRRHWDAAGSTVASMGPRLFSRGKRKDAVIRHLELSRFNGAAAFQPRKGGGAVLASKVGGWLQWGRGFSAAESTMPAQHTQ